MNYFNLTTLLVVVGLLAFPLSYLAQAGFAEARFEIQSNQLYVDSLGVLRGDLVCLCSIPGRETTKMVCRIEQSHLADLESLERNATYSVRYRWEPPFGLFAKQDPYGMFLTSKLGFRAEDVVGQMKMIDQSVVLLRQKQAPTLTR
jgi:hypothetical protein